MTQKMEYSMETWFEEHASEYHGQWIAVNQGELVAAAGTYEELQDMIAYVEDRVSTVIVRVVDPEENAFSFGAN